jgi:hypothetical protein
MHEHRFPLRGFLEDIFNSRKRLWSDVINGFNVDFKRLRFLYNSALIANEADMTKMLNEIAPKTPKWRINTEKETKTKLGFVSCALAENDLFGVELDLLVALLSSQASFGFHREFLAQELKVLPETNMHLIANADPPTIELTFVQGQGAHFVFSSDFNLFYISDEERIHFSIIHCMTVIALREDGKHPTEGLVRWTKRDVPRPAIAIDVAPPPSISTSLTSLPAIHTSLSPTTPAAAFNSFRFRSQRFE